MAAGRADGSFAGLARRRYGRTVADAVPPGLLAQALGPVPATACRRGSPATGSRAWTSGSSCSTPSFGRKADRRNADGSFFYPVRGIGMLADALAARLRARRGPPLHAGRAGSGTTARGSRSIAVAGRGSAFPSTRSSARCRSSGSSPMLDPPPPEDILRSRPCADAPEPRARRVVPPQALRHGCRHRLLPRPAASLHARHGAPQPQRGDEPPGPHVAGGRDPLRPRGSALERGRRASRRDHAAAARGDRVAPERGDRGHRGS